MFHVFFYKDRNGRRPVLEYIKGLSSKTDKDSRIKLVKIREYIKYLREMGQQAKEPYAKHLEGEIWELRPLRDRILYAAWDGKSFILLHHFKKDTQKTPRREIKQAKRNLADYRERSKDNE
jgi:phage-related protein